MTVWRRRSFAAAGLTQVPSGPYVPALARHFVGNIKVTRSGYDDIGAVLRVMDVDFEPWDGNYEDCDLLFMNCGTSDVLDPAQLRQFVEGGGCLYASDLTSGFVSQAFPGIFNFGGSGFAGTVNAVVVDPELQAIVGASTQIHFDMDQWSILRSARADVLVAAAPGPYGEVPLMVGTQLGNGAIFYTSFHNRAQASASEQVLLQLLVLKQIGAKSSVSLMEASQRVGVNLTALKAQVGGA